MSESALSLRGAKGEPPQYFENEEVGKVLAMVMALAGEFCVMRDRLDTIERLLESGKPVSRDAIEAYVPSAEVRQQRDAWRQEFLAIVLRVLHAEKEALAQAAEAANDSYDSIVAQVESN